MPVDNKHSPLLGSARGAVHVESFRRSSRLGSPCATTSHGRWDGRRRGRRTVLATCAALVLMLAAAGSRIFAGPPQDAKYVGQKTCRTCHLEPYKKWKRMKHANAWSNLPRKDRARPKCYRCHVTGHGEDGGFVSEKRTPHLTGVQCESCHGPGSPHVAAAKSKEPVVRVMGLINRVPQNTCVACHNPHKTHEEYEKECGE